MKLFDRKKKSMYTQLNHFVVYLKWAQHCKSTIFQQKFKNTEHTNQALDKYMWYDSIYTKLNLYNWTIDYLERGLNPRSRKIPHSAWQLNPGITGIESAL